MTWQPCREYGRITIRNDEIDAVLVVSGTMKPRDKERLAVEVAKSLNKDKQHADDNRASK